MTAMESDPVGAPGAVAGLDPSDGDLGTSAAAVGALAHAAVSALVRTLPTGCAFVVQVEGGRWRVVAGGDHAALGVVTGDIVTSGETPWAARLLGELAGHPDVARLTGPGRVAVEAGDTIATIPTAVVEPITVGDGMLVGAVAVMDRAPVPLTETETGLVATFALFLAHAYDGMWSHRELEAAHDVAELTSVRQRRLLTGVTHDFRTPLSVILGMADHLARDASAERVALAARAIRANATRLALMVDGLLEAEARDAGELIEAPRDVDLRGLLSEIAAESAHLLTREGVTVTFAGGGWAHAPPLTLRRLLLNLTANAVKNTRTGTINISSEESGAGGAVITVADTGRGMTTGEVDRFAEAYARGDESEGFGLGLSIVRRLAHHLGAEISITSAPDRGTTFRLVLPDTGGRPT